MITDEELRHPNNKLWQEQGEHRFRGCVNMIKTGISGMTVQEIVDQKNIILEMQMILNRVGELKGLV